MPAIFDDFGHVTEALSRCEAYLVNTRHAGDPASLLRKVRLALSVVNDGAPSNEELEPFIGRNWVVVKRRTKSDRYFHGCCGGERQLLPREYYEAQRQAIEARFPR